MELVALFLSLAIGYPITIALTTRDFFPYGVGARDTVVSGVFPHTTLFRASVPYVVYEIPSNAISVSSSTLIISGSAFFPVYDPNLVFPFRGQIRVINLFYTAIDTSVAGAISFRVSSNDPVMRRIDNVINGACALEQYTSASILVATWERVAAFNTSGGASLLNSFQCVVASNGTSTFVLFLYADINWVRTGGRFREFAPQAGFAKGADNKFFKLPGTETPEGLRNLVRSTNMGREGLWGYKVSGPDIRNITCVSGIVSLMPSYLVLHRGDNAQFNCTGPERSIFVWLLNGVTLSANMTNLSLTPDSRILQIKGATVALNHTIIQCVVTYNANLPAEYRRSVTTSATLLVQGILDAVFDVRIAFSCPSFILTWQAHFTLTPEETTYCVTVSLGSTSRVVAHACSQATTFTTKLSCVYTGNFYDVSIVPVNPGGNGPETFFRFPAYVVPTELNVHQGLTAEFVCKAPLGVGDIQWMINGVRYESGLPNVVVSHGSEESRIQFLDVSSKLNRTSVQCATSYGDLDISSTIGTLFVHGVLGPVSNLAAQTSCPFHMDLSWEAPWSLTPRQTSYCISITKISTNLVVFSKCNILTTSFSVKLQDNICGDNYAITVSSVSQAGNGSEATVFLNAAPVTERIPNKWPETGTWAIVAVVFAVVVCTLLATMILLYRRARRTSGLEDVSDDDDIDMVGINNNNIDDGNQDNNDYSDYVHIDEYG